MKKCFFLLLFPIFLNACALCALYTPTVHAKIDFIKAENTLLGFQTQWTFSENFTSDLLNSYDYNSNNILDSEELEEIQMVLLQYIQPRNFLMKIAFYDENDPESIIKLKFTDIKTSYKNKNVILNYKVNFSLPIVENRNIKIVLEDKEGFFNFTILPTEKQELGNSLYLLSNTNSNAAFYKISKSNTFHLKRVSDITPNLSAISEPMNEQSYYEDLKNILQKYTDKIKTTLQDIQKGNSFYKMFVLLSFSFLYGFFHALGPGHGKTLVTSYFVANGGNWYKALLFSFRIGMIHVVSAFILVFASVYIIKTFVSKVLNDISVYTSYLSASIIIILSLFMLYKKFKIQKQNKNTQWSTHKNNHKHSCSCNTCSSIATNTNKGDWAVAFSAGMIPCAGTVVIFILTITLGNYLTGILSAIFMAIGMGSVIFISSIFGQYLHVKISNNFTKLINIIEYLAILFILMLGMSLLISPLQI